MCSRPLTTLATLRWTHSTMSTPFAYQGGSNSTWQSSCTFPGVKQRGITTFKTCLSHKCYRFPGKAFAARPMVPIEQVSWWNGCSSVCLLPESDRMRRRHNRENKKAQGLTSETDSLTGKLEGQSCNCSSGLTPEVEFHFLNIGISYILDTLQWLINLPGPGR